MKIYCTIFALITMLLAVPAGTADDVKMQVGSFDSAGVKIAYLEAGKGPPVLLVHGLYCKNGSLPRFEHEPRWNMKSQMTSKG